MSSFHFLLLSSIALVMSILLAHNIVNYWDQFVLIFASVYKLENAYRNAQTFAIFITSPKKQKYNITL